MNRYQLKRGFRKAFRLVLLFGRLIVSLGLCAWMLILIGLGLISASAIIVSDISICNGLFPPWLVLACVAWQLMYIPQAWRKLWRIGVQ